MFVIFHCNYLIQLVKTNTYAKCAILSLIFFLRASKFIIKKQHNNPNQANTKLSINKVLFFFCDHTLLLKLLLLVCCLIPKYIEVQEPFFFVFCFFCAYSMYLIYIFYSIFICLNLISFLLFLVCCALANKKQPTYKKKRCKK